MRRLFLRVLTSAALALPVWASGSDDANPPPMVIVVVGAPGEEEFGQTFQTSARQWEDACRTARTDSLVIGLDESAATNDLAQFKAALDHQPPKSERELWLVLIGHGTFDGKEAKFNLRGPDLSATELAAWLEPFERPVAVIDTTSSSAPFLKKLSRAGRVIITATRSGYEQNYARFGQFISKAIADPKADLDKDGQVSLLESFLMAANSVAEYYKAEGRLATEHPLLDDNGDALGTPPEWFRGVRAIKKPAEGALLDGVRAHQLILIRSDAERKLSPALLAERNALEAKVEELREKKPNLPEDEYYARLEELLLKLARVYETSEPGP